MKTPLDEIKRPIISRSVLAKTAISVAFLFWIYLVWSSVTALNLQLKAESDKSLAVHNLQVEYKNEVQEWKNLLLRSDNREALDKNWQSFDAKYQGVATATQEIIQQNDVRRITEPLKDFATAHAGNHEQYRRSKEVLVKSGFGVRQADAMVVGIDRPLLDMLEKAAVAMQEEQNNSKDRIISKAANQIEQSLVVLALMTLLLVWMPKW